MLQIDIKDVNNNIQDKITLKDVIFDCQADSSIVHTAVKAYLANVRQGTHATKTRAMVSGGGKKPWKQKHTGRARHGSTRSPIWKGGGTVFGPQPRDYSIKLPKAIKRTALHKALSLKLQDNQIIVIDTLLIDQPKTKTIIEILNKLDLQGKTVLFIVDKYDKNILLSVRNIPTVDCLVVDEINAYHVALYDYLIFTAKAIERLQSEATQ